VSLNKIYNEYKEHVQFLHIYLREAHPRERWWFGEGLFPSIFIKLAFPKLNLDVSDPKTIEERIAIAKIFQKSIGYEIPIYIDAMDDKAGQMYAARPSRLYFLGKEGTVLHVGDVGQNDLGPDKLESKIKNYLESENSLNC